MDLMMMKKFAGVCVILLLFSCQDEKSGVNFRSTLNEDSTGRIGAMQDIVPDVDTQVDDGVYQPIIIGGMTTQYNEPCTKDAVKTRPECAPIEIRGARWTSLANSGAVDQKNNKVILKMDGAADIEYSVMSKRSFRSQGGIQYLLSKSSAALSEE